MGKVTKQTKASQLFGTVGANDAYIMWKVDTIMQGGLTDFWR